MTEYKYFTIHELPRAKNRKTSDYDVINRSGGYSLGKIKWYGAWRQYCFFPEHSTVWNSGCLKDILDFMEKLKQAENFATLLAEVKARDAGEKSWQDKAQKWHNEMLRCLQRAESAEQAVEDMKELLEVREAAYRKLKEEKSEGNDSGRA